MPRLIRLALSVLAFAGASATTLDFSSQASGWLGASRDTSILGQAGLRYIPSLSMAFLPYVDAELSVNAFASAQTRLQDSVDSDATKLYRLWARFSTARFEARAGLQKINFGSAMLLRPLMWFDRVDPRDPLELTDGVYGLLARYYFQNNANVWAWGLLGDSSPKGWEQLGSVRWKPELGGRAQIPFPRGEAAATYHHRTVDWSQVLKIPEMLNEQAEDRFGVDAKADIGIGLWAEAVFSHETRRISGATGWGGPWTRVATAGVDYTFGVGSGLGVMVEHMLVSSGSSEPFGKGHSPDAHLSALMLSYPIGILDNLRAIALYDWRSKGVYSFVGWQRTLDSWLFSVTAFWNPDTPVSLGAPGGGAAGKGIQLMVVFNH